MIDNDLAAINSALDSDYFYVLQISRRENGTHCRHQLLFSAAGAVSERNFGFAMCKTGYHFALTP